VELGNLTIHVEKLEALVITGNCTLTTKFFPGLSWRSGSYSLVDRTSNMDRTTSERNEEENGSNFGIIQEGETEIRMFVAGCVYDVFCSATYFSHWPSNYFILSLTIVQVLSQINSIFHCVHFKSNLTMSNVSTGIGGKVRSSP
jgi:hypothetical protein